MGDVVSLSTGDGTPRPLKEAYDHSCAMDEALGHIAQALKDIEAGRDPAGAFQSLTSNLLHLLRLAERSPSVEGTLDHLHEVARRLVDDINADGVAGPGRYQDLHAAYLTFRSQISAAKPRPSSA